jgi:tRNA A-37 threonylcarbamoyl transferase component Bud32
MILETLAALALKELVDAGKSCLGADGGGADSKLLDPEKVTGFIVKRFTDHGDRLPKALSAASDRAWRALEVALAGESLWSWFDKAEDKAFRQQVRDFLAAAPHEGQVSHDENFRKLCLAELRAARKDKLLTATSIRPRDLAREAGNFARYSQPQHLIDAQWGAVCRIAQTVDGAGYKYLAHYLRLRPQRQGPGGPVSDPPLLAIGVRYFFRREVEANEALYRGLTFDRLQGLAEAQQAGLDALHGAIARHNETIAQALELFDKVERGLLNVADAQRSALAVLSRVEQRLVDLQREQQKVLQGQQQVVQSQQRVAEGQQQVLKGQLDLRAELRSASTEQADLLRQVLQAVEQQRLDRRELQPRDSLKIESEAERKLVKQLVVRYRSLPADQQNLPALLNALGKLEVGVGAYDDAQRNFQKAASLVHGQPSAEAEARFNAYRAALERHNFDEALRELRVAVRLDAGRFAPFPFDKYEPIRILGAGGFGVAYLCKHVFMNAEVVVKTLAREDLQQDLNTLFAEAQHLRRLNHACIIGIQDCALEGPKESGRPYVVMDYFPGQTLEDHVKKHGPISRTELALLARLIAQGLLAAHGQNILHRDVKPGNVLVRRLSSGGWEVKLIDFGLAVSQQAVTSTVRQADTWGRSVVGKSIAGTLEYAAPEQMGRLPGVTVSPASDVYGWGKTCCYALYGTPNLSYEEWQELQGPLGQLLGRCVAERPEKRPPDFQTVLARMDAVLGPATVVAVRPVADALPAGPPAGKSRPVKVVPVKPAPEEPLEVERVEDVLTAQPAGASRRRRGPEVAVTRTGTNLVLKFDGHELACAWSWGSKLQVTFDGRTVTSGFALLGGTYQFVADEGGEQVQYEVKVTSGVHPVYTVRRNGAVLYTG